ncbi:hypothetical protein C8R45DRAFT_1083434 [Mycena sanguinolenta]|nr:hypothetical protein C8R45DRAFT_1083434 [Mycena sanguinolenta]
MDGKIHNPRPSFVPASAPSLIHPRPRPGPMIHDRVRRTGVAMPALCSFGIGNETVGVRACRERAQTRAVQQALDEAPVSTTTTTTTTTTTATVAASAAAPTDAAATTVMARQWDSLKLGILAIEANYCPMNQEKVKTKKYTNQLFLPANQPTLARAAGPLMARFGKRATRRRRPSLMAATVGVMKGALPPWHYLSPIIALRENRLITGELAREIIYISPANLPGYLGQVGVDDTVLLRFPGSKPWRSCIEKVLLVARTGGFLAIGRMDTGTGESIVRDAPSCQWSIISKFAAHSIGQRARKNIYEEHEKVQGIRGEICERKHIGKKQKHPRRRRLQRVSVRANKKEEGWNGRRFGVGNDTGIDDGRASVSSQSAGVRLGAWRCGAALDEAPSPASASRPPPPPVVPALFAVQGIRARAARARIRIQRRRRHAPHHNPPHAAQGGRALSGEGGGRRRRGRRLTRGRSGSGRRRRGGGGSGCRGGEGGGGGELPARSTRGCDFSITLTRLLVPPLPSEANATTDFNLRALRYRDLVNDFETRDGDGRAVHRHALREDVHYGDTYRGRSWPSLSVIGIARALAMTARIRGDGRCADGIGGGGGGCRGGGRRRSGSSARSTPRALTHSGAVSGSSDSVGVVCGGSASRMDDATNAAHEGPAEDAAVHVGGAWELEGTRPVNLSSMVVASGWGAECPCLLLNVEVEVDARDAPVCLRINLIGAYSTLSEPPLDSMSSVKNVEETRTNIIQDLITAEQKYVRDLQQTCSLSGAQTPHSVRFIVQRDVRRSNALDLFGLRDRRRHYLYGQHPSLALVSAASNNHRTKAQRLGMFGYWDN